MDIKFDIKGLDACLDNMEKLKKRVDESLPGAAKAGALEIVKYTKENCPRKTGKLSRSYHQRTEVRRTHQIIKRIGTDVDYAPHQEFGTVKQPGKPHLRPAAFNHGEEIREAVFNVVNTDIKTQTREFPKTEKI